MAFFFGDGFDLYGGLPDFAGHWDSAFGPVQTINTTFAGRFTGSRGLYNNNSNVTPYITKTSGANDAVHHISLAFSMFATTSGSQQFHVTLLDGTSVQCTIVFNRDFSITLFSGTASGTLIATYPAAIAAINTWTQFEFEIVIHNTTGSFKVRRNGNTTDDFSATGLNTRGGTTNNYANKVGIGASGSGSTQVMDDFLWRSDASSVPWVGDVRCFTRLPATDASAAWSRQATFMMQPFPGPTSTQSITSGLASYTPFYSQGGTIGSVIVNLLGNFTGTLKVAIFASTVPAGGGQPGTLLGSSSIVNPVFGNNSITFSPALSIPKSAQFWVGLCFSASTGLILNCANAVMFQGVGFYHGISYASFPPANPSAVGGLTADRAYPIFPVVTPAYNADAVCEYLQDWGFSYVFSSTVGQSDLYTLQGMSSSPGSVLAVVTRGLIQKSDAGTRSITLDVKSGSTTSSSTPMAVGTNWNWFSKQDFVDPNTGSAWTAVAVNNMQIGVTLAV